MTDLTCATGWKLDLTPHPEIQDDTYLLIQPRIGSLTTQGDFDTICRCFQWLCNIASSVIEIPDGVHLKVVSERLHSDELQPLIGMHVDLDVWDFGQPSSLADDISQLSSLADSISDGLEAYVKKIGVNSLLSHAENVS